MVIQDKYVSDHCLSGPLGSTDREALLSWRNKLLCKGGHKPSTGLPMALSVKRTGMTYVTTPVQEEKQPTCRTWCLIWLSLAIVDLLNVHMETHITD